MKYHGNYCGPYWSAGKQQSSVVDPGVLPIDDFDQTCAIHDAAYATQPLNELDRHDDIFIRNNLFKGVKRTMAALAVSTNKLTRHEWITGPRLNIMVNKNNKKPSNLRGASAPPKPSVRRTTQMSTVPATYGFSLKMETPRVIRNGKGTVIHGSDFATSVQSSIATNTYAPAASVLLNPAYFSSSMLGNVARTYEKFRFTRAVIQYIPQVPTTTTGQIVMCSTRSVKEPFINGAASSFLSRALSQSNAIATPIWKEASLSVNCGNEWSIVDGFIDTDLDDSIQEEVQVYSTSGTSQTTGILILHYTIEFKDPLYAYHSQSIPNPVGNGNFSSAIDNSAVNAIGDAIILSNAGFATAGTPYGTIFRLVFRPNSSLLPAPIASWGDVAATVTDARTSQTTYGFASTPIALSPGTVLYGLQSISGVGLYASLEQAKSGSSGYLVYANTTTALGSWSFIISLVQVAPSTAITTQ